MNLNDDWQRQSSSDDFNAPPLSLMSVIFKFYRAISYHIVWLPFFIWYSQTSSSTYISWSLPLLLFTFPFLVFFSFLPTKTLYMLQYLLQTQTLKRMLFISVDGHEIRIETISIYLQSNQYSHSLKQSERSITYPAHSFIAFHIAIFNSWRLMLVGFQVNWRKYV